MRKLAALSLAAIVIVGGWIALWFIAAQWTGSAIDRWIEAERSRDRYWSCSEREVGGFPMEVRVDCVNPTFTSKFGPVQKAASERFIAHASLLSPFDVTFSVIGPARLIGRGKEAATLIWSELGGGLSIRRDAPEISLRGQALRIAEASGAIGNWTNAGASDIDLRLQPAPDRAPGSDVQTLSVNIAGVRASPLDALFENDAPLRLALSANILNANAAISGTLAERIDNWSSSGGRVQIASLGVEKGDSRLDANGDLSLDDSRRLSGPLSVRIAGIQPILARLNLPAAPLAIEGLLRGGARNRGASLLDNRTLTFSFRSGRVYIGPIRTPLMIPPLL